MKKDTETMKQETSQQLEKEPSLQGLIGVWYGRTNLTDPKGVDEITTLDLDWKFFQQPGQDRGEMWSARWEGFLYGPVDGSVTFYTASEHGMSVFIDDQSIVEWTGREAKRSGGLPMKRCKSYPIQVTYIHDHGDKSYLNLQWSWAGHSKTSIPRENLHYSQFQRARMKEIPPKEFAPGHHSIGFRIVQAVMPNTKPLAPEDPFTQQCVAQNQ